MALIDNAATVGEHLLGAAARARARHPLIGDVRGKGLMIGIELVKDRETKVRAIEERDRLVDAMFAKGVLVLGAGRNAIRLCPPLVLTTEQADFCVDALDAALGTLEKGR